MSRPNTGRDSVELTLSAIRRNLLEATTNRDLYLCLYQVESLLLKHQGNPDARLLKHIIEAVIDRTLGNEDHSIFADAHAHLIIALFGLRGSRYIIIQAIWFTICFVIAMTPIRWTFLEFPFVIPFYFAIFILWEIGVHRIKEICNPYFPVRDQSEHGMLGRYVFQARSYVERWEAVISERDRLSVKKVLLGEGQLPSDETTS